MANEKDIQDVIKTLIAEGIGEGQEGMRRIAETILNRADQRGISPAEVVRQRAQYTGYSAPGPAAVRAQSDPSALTAAQAAWQMAQGPDDPTNGANHYWNPNIVNPSWAGSMTSLGQFGNHAFATDRAVAPRPVAPTPASQSPLMASSRAVTSPSGGNTALQNALAQYATREGNRVTPMTMQGTASTVASFPTVAQAPATRNVQSRSVPGPSVNDAARRAALSIGSNQTYAGAERIPVAVPRSVSTADAARRAALSIGANQSFAGQERAPVSARAAVPMAMGVSQSYAGQDRAPVRSIPGPTAPVKTAQRLMPSSAAMAFNPLAKGGAVQSGGLSRDALSRQAQYNATALNPPAARLPALAPAAQVARQAPTPFTRPQTAAPIMVSAVRPPVAAPVQPVMSQPQMPLMAQQPLQVLVQGSNTIQPRPMSAVQQLQAQGLSPSQAYAAANAGNTPQSVYDRVRGERDSGGSGGVQPRGTIW